MNIIILCGGKGERFSKNVKHFLSEPLKRIHSWIEKHCFSIQVY